MTDKPSLLDEHGLSSRKLDLPEGLFNELRGGWDRFCNDEAEQEASQAFPSPAPLQLPALPEVERAPMTISSWVMKDDADPASFVWSVATTLVSIGLIVHMVNRFTHHNGLGDGTTHSLILLICLLINPFWWSLVIDAGKKQARWWTTLPILSLISVTLFVGVENNALGGQISEEMKQEWSWNEYPPDSWGDWLNIWFNRCQDAWEPILFWLDMGLLTLATKLPWIFKKNPALAKRRAEEARQAEARQVDKQVRARVATQHAEHKELANARNLDDPAVLLRFLTHIDSTLWKRRRDEWTTRLQTLANEIAQRRVIAVAEKAHETNAVTLARIEEEMLADIATLEAERLEITAFLDQMENGKETLKYIASGLQKGFDRYEAARARIAWQEKNLPESQRSRATLERDNAELRSVLIFFKNLLMDQSARIEAQTEMLVVEPSPTAPPLTSEMEHLRAGAEIARAIIDREGPLDFDPHDPPRRPRQTT